MRDGFVRVAVGTPEIRVADCEFNAKSIIALMDEAAKKQVKLLVLPELCLTGASAQDLLWQDTLIQGALDGLQEICVASEVRDLVTVVGMPLELRGRLYNCAAVVQGGRVLAMIPQAEPKGASKNWFAAWDGEYTTLEDGLFEETMFGSDVILECTEMPALRFAVEIGNDLANADADAAAFNMVNVLLQRIHLSGKITELKLSHPLNASSPIVVSVWLVTIQVSASAS